MSAMRSQITFARTPTRIRQQCRRRWTLSEGKMPHSDLPTAGRGSYRDVRTRPARTGHPHRRPPQPAARHRREPALPQAGRVCRARAAAGPAGPLASDGAGQPSREPSMQQPDQSEAGAPTPRKRSQPKLIRQHLWVCTMGMPRGRQWCQWSHARPSIDSSTRARRRSASKSSIARRS